MNITHFVSDCGITITDEQKTAFQSLGGSISNCEPTNASPGEGTEQTTVPVYVERGEIKGRFMSIIMNPMPALITTILDSLKCAPAAGNHLPRVSGPFTPSR